MWEEADSASKRGAYATLATALDETTRLLAPIAPPYMTERMYQTLDGEATTVHQLDYPEPDEDLHDPELERDVAVLRDVEEAAANARQQAGRKLRWPVPRVVVESDDENVIAAVERLSDLIADRVNAREVTVTDAFDELVETAEPQMGAIGPAFGADAQKVMNAVQGATARGGRGGEVTVDGDPVDLADEMVEYVAEPPEHVSGADFDGGRRLRRYLPDPGDRIGGLRPRRDPPDSGDAQGARSGRGGPDPRRRHGRRRSGGRLRRRARRPDRRRGARRRVDRRPERRRGRRGRSRREWEVEGVAVTIGIEPVA